MDRLRVILEESKLYGMVLAICAVVWICGYRARIDQRWHESEWLAPPREAHINALVELELNDPYDVVLE